MSWPRCVGAGTAASCCSTWPTGCRGSRSASRCAARPPGRSVRISARCRRGSCRCANPVGGWRCAPSGGDWSVPTTFPQRCGSTPPTKPLRAYGSGPRSRHTGHFWTWRSLPIPTWRSGRRITRCGRCGIPKNGPSSSGPCCGCETESAPASICGRSTCRGWTPSSSKPARVC